MPKVFLTNQRKFDVAKDEVERIERELATGEKMIRINDTLTVRHGEIKGFEKEPKRSGYDLNIPTDRQIVKDFEAMLKALESKEPLRELSWYGHPLPKHPGLVVNELCGGVHWSVVQYALDQLLISRRDKPSISWAILDVGGYTEFRSKLDGLSNLRDRRAYSKQMENETYEAIADLKESMTMPTLDLPF